METSRPRFEQGRLSSIKSVKGDRLKYISVVLMVLILIWTWSLATAERPFRLEQHKQVEAGVEEDIRAFIQRRYPQTSDIYCQQLYTEVVKPGQELIARFRCQAVGQAGTDDTTEQVFEGHLNLRSDDGFETWSETGGTISSPEIRFLKGVEITRSGDGESAEPAPSPTPAEPKK